MNIHQSVLKMAVLFMVVPAAAGARVSLVHTDLTACDSDNTVATVASSPNETIGFAASPTNDFRNVARAVDGTIISVTLDEVMPQSLPSSDVPTDRFIEEDSAFGPGTITLDTVTEFKWLDLTITASYTYNEVVAKLGPSGMFEGYRLGLDVEVKEVMNAFGVVGILPPQPAHDEFMSFFGITKSQGEWPETFGYASPLVGGAASVFGLDFFWSGAPTYSGTTGGLEHNPGINFEGFGTWILIGEASNPTPVLTPVIWLLLK